MRNASGTPGKQHRVFFYKAFHQMLRPGKIFYELRGMIKNIEQEYSPGSRPGFYHIDIFTKSLVVVSRIDRGVGITFYIII